MLNGAVKCNRPHLQPDCVFTAWWSFSHRKMTSSVRARSRMQRGRSRSSGGTNYFNYFFTFRNNQLSCGFVATLYCPSFRVLTSELGPCVFMQSKFGHTTSSFILNPSFILYRLGLSAFLLNDC